jgi:hypothetical protein
VDLATQRAVGIVPPTSRTLGTALRDLLIRLWTAMWDRKDVASVARDRGPRRRDSHGTAD